MEAGIELRKFSRHHYIALRLLIGGSLIVVAGILVPPLVIAGTAVYLAGGVLLLEAPSHIGRAGKSLMKSKTYSFLKRKTKQKELKLSQVALN